MAICVLIRKQSEDDKTVFYRYGFDDPLGGTLAMDKATGECVMLKADRPSNPDVCYSRAVRKLKLHWEKGEFPDETMYAA